MSDLIHIVAGARPNFMKIAPLIREMQTQQIKFKLVHTGQHYDYNMSKIFFDSLGIPEPDYFLNVGSHSHAVQTATIMIEFEKVLLQDSPRLVIVVGDVNSTIACALVAKKLFIKVAHIEAGLRSFDRLMPEELNRVLTDQISDYLFTTEPVAKKNLLREGIDEAKIFFVGNVMIDTLIANLDTVDGMDSFKNFQLNPHDYALVTIHRPSNVDRKEDLGKVVEILNFIASKVKLLFPIHPRTHKNLLKYNFMERMNTKNIIITEPVGYLEFLSLMANSKFILTDSGGIQEEASYLKIPVLTMRKNTERPITIEQGTNYLVGSDLDKIQLYVNQIMEGTFKKGKDIEMWDGLAAKRIIQIIKENLFV